MDQDDIIRLDGELTIAEQREARANGHSNGSANGRANGHANARSRKPEGEEPKALIKLEPWQWDLVKHLQLSEHVDRDTGDKSYTIHPTSANLAAILQHHRDWSGVIAFDAFRCRIVTTKPPKWHPLDAPAEAKAGPWTDADSARLSHWLARTSICNMAPITMGVKTVDTGVLVAADANSVHPVRDYLRSISWDGVARVDSLFSRYFGAEDNEYTRAVSACFLLGAVARVMSPGCKVDLVPIVEGPQGIGKSTGLDILGGKYFTDSKIEIGNKDAYQMLRGVWIVELGELSSLSKSDVESAKAFITSRVDRYRPSYGRHEVEIPRQTVFIGSTNARTYLHDATGGRRYPPVKTGKIDIAELTKDRDAIWGLCAASSAKSFGLGEGLCGAKRRLLMLLEQRHVQIATALLPRLMLLGGNGSHQPQTAGRIGKRAHQMRTPLDLFVESLQQIR